MSVYSSIMYVVALTILALVFPFCSYPAWGRAERILYPVWVVLIGFGAATTILTIVRLANRG
jgi:hypothetical protein